MIEWTKDLSVDVDEIDQQHQEIFRRIDNLLEACNHGKGKAMVGDIITFLGDYVSKHFGVEEKYMTKYKYPKYLKHKEQHDDFIKTFIGLKQKFEAEGPGLSLVINTNHMLVSWLQNHIRNTDKELGSFLKANLK
ncbi:MAG: bacteriohemerythrin [Bacillota bacterium]